MPPRKAAGAGAKAQRPITSFLAFKRSPDTPARAAQDSTRIDKIEEHDENLLGVSHQNAVCAEKAAAEPQAVGRNNSPVAKRQKVALEEGKPPPADVILPSRAASNEEERARLHERFQNKLVGGHAAGQEGRAAARAAALVPQPHAKLTPLEQQVTYLKRQNPGILLVVEVRGRIYAVGFWSYMAAVSGVV